MTARFSKAATVPAALLLGTLLTIVLALVQMVQIPLGALPADSSRLATAPVWHFAHVLGGASFGILGPVQFGRVLAGRYGLMHRVAGRAFVMAGALLSASSLGLLWTFPAAYSPAVSGGRLLFGMALGAALAIAVHAVRQRDIRRHRNWMIRAYAIGMGATAVSMLFFPVYVVTGTPPQGPLADALFMGSWVACIACAEAVVRRL